MNRTFAAAFVFQWNWYEKQWNAQTEITFDLQITSISHMPMWITHCAVLDQCWPKLVKFKFNSLCDTSHKRLNIKDTLTFLHSLRFPVVKREVLNVLFSNEFLCKEFNWNIFNYAAHLNGCPLSWKCEPVSYVSIVRWKGHDVLWFANCNWCSTLVEPEKMRANDEKHFFRVFPSHKYNRMKEENGCVSWNNNECRPECGAIIQLWRSFSVCNYNPCCWPKRWAKSRRLSAHSASVYILSIRDIFCSALCGVRIHWLIWIRTEFYWKEEFLSKKKRANQNQSEFYI